MPKEQLRFFLDRGVGSKQLPTYLRSLGWQIPTMNERYGNAAGQHLSDADWIRDAAGRGEAILCKDKAIAKNPLEAEAVWFSNAKVFAIASAQITGEQMIQRVGAHQATIVRWAERAPGPFVAAVYATGLRRIELRLPWPGGLLMIRRSIVPGGAVAPPQCCVAARWKSRACRARRQSSDGTTTVRGRSMLRISSGGP